MLVPFLIAGELFVLFISYIISGVWKEGMDVITLLNKVNDALDHPFKNYWTEHSLKAMIVGTLIYSMADFCILQAEEILCMEKSMVLQVSQT